MPVPTLVGDRVTLRAPRPDDRRRRLELGRHPEIVRMFGGSYDGQAMSPEEVDRWYRGLSAPNSWVVEVDGAFARTVADAEDLLRRAAALVLDEGGS